MLYSCTHMTTVSVKGLKHSLLLYRPRHQLCSPQRHIPATVSPYDIIIYDCTGVDAESRRRDTSVRPSVAQSTPSIRLSVRPSSRHSQVINDHYRRCRPTARRRCFMERPIQSRRIPYLSGCLAGPSV